MADHGPDRYDELEVVLLPGAPEPGGEFRTFLLAAVWCLDCRPNVIVREVPAALLHPVTPVLPHPTTPRRAEL